MMNLLEAFFTNGQIVIFAGLILLIEAILLLLFFKKRLPPNLILWNTFSGLGLIGALYSALMTYDWKIIAGFLTLSLFGHLGDMACRLSNADTTIP